MGQGGRTSICADAVFDVSTIRNGSSQIGHNKANEAVCASSISRCLHHKISLTRKDCKLKSASNQQTRESEFADEDT